LSGRRRGKVRRRRLARSMFLPGDCDWGPDVLHVLEHEDGVFLGVLKFLEKQKGLLVVAETALYTIAW
jgi:hypothetical protein